VFLLKVAVAGVGHAGVCGSWPGSRICRGCSHLLLSAFVLGYSRHQSLRWFGRRLYAFGGPPCATLSGVRSSR